MSPGWIVALAGIVGFALVAGAAAQGLGDAAARERAKRAAQTQAKKPPEARSFTNDDLAEGRPAGSKAEATAEPSASSESDDERGRGPADDPRAREQPFVDAIRSAEEAVTATENRIRQLSDKLNPMSLSYIYGSGGSNDANEELRVRQELREAEDALRAARATVIDSTRQLEDFRRRGHGVPPRD